MTIPFIQYMNSSVSLPVFHHPPVEAALDGVEDSGLLTSLWADVTDVRVTLRDPAVKVRQT